MAAVEPPRSQGKVSAVSYAFAWPQQGCSQEKLQPGLQGTQPWPGP